MKSNGVMTAKLKDDFFGDYPDGRMFATLPMYRAGDVVLVLGKTPSGHYVVESIMPTSPGNFIRPNMVPERFLFIDQPYPSGWSKNEGAKDLEPSIGYAEIIAKNAIARINDWDDFPEESKEHEEIIGKLVHELRDQVRRSDIQLWDEHSYLNSRKYTVHRFGRQFLCFKREDFESIDHLDENVSNYYFDCRRMNPANEMLQQLKYLLGDTSIKSEYTKIMEQSPLGVIGNELIMKKDGKAMMSSWVYFIFDHFDELYADSKDQQREIETLLNQIVVVAHEWPGNNEFLRTAFAEPRFRLICYYNKIGSHPVKILKDLIPEDEISVASEA